jgi:hypothetical protein
MAWIIGYGSVSPSGPENEMLRDLALSYGDGDLTTRTDLVSRPGAPRNVSFLLLGLSGTDKSVFARHLAACVGLNVVQKRCSNLFGSFVGQTEVQIVGALAESHAIGAFLISMRRTAFCSTAVAPIGLGR